MPHLNPFDGYICELFICGDEKIGSFGKVGVCKKIHEHLRKCQIFTRNSQTPYLDCIFLRRRDEEQRPIDEGTDA